FEQTVMLNTKIKDRNGILLYETLHSDQGKTTAIALENLPADLINATLAIEDIHFYSNSGIDMGGILRAVFLNLKSGEVISGGSTITQQLVRNTIGVNHKRTFLQKIKESLLALRVTKVFTKKEILEMYLNKIYYGNLNYGVAAASMGYFGKNVANLDLSESAFLAGLPQSPNRYNPFRDRPAALERRNYVLTLMRKQNLISEQDYKDAEAEELVFENHLTRVRAPHFVNMILSELENRFGDAYLSEGLDVTTTLDYYLYEKIQAIAQKQVGAISNHHVTNASVVVLDPKTAEVMALLGSVDYFDKSIEGEVNNAISLRQPGSAIKPITYAVAFEKGWNGATSIEDEPVRFFTAEGLPYFPQNYDNKYHGTVTVREALANSYNIAAIKTIDFAGIEPVLTKAREMGLTTLNETADYYGLALTLGDGEVRLIDLTGVYMAFANGGIQKEVRMILEIKDSKGRVLPQKNQVSKRVLPESIAFMITAILSDNTARILQFGLNSALELNHPAAVKTGTTRNFRDNWTMGYTPDFVVGVWAGNSDGSEMEGISGVEGAGPIWHDVMEELHHNKPKAEFQVPLTVKKQPLCVKKGKEGGCLSETTEWVPVDFVPLKPEEKAPAFRIVKPFDLDVFQFDPNIPADVQQIKFRIEKSDSPGEVTWFINEQPGGSGDEMEWNLTPGNFTIQAVSGTSVTEPIHIVVEEK
ncbi:hypothetical protein COY07_05730, partial [Candidatus Peregrinibacteria bacterium CG_4_10_14_0_2_um_filter_43_11]